MKALFLALGATLMSSSQEIRGDEIVRLPINYKGSLNERSQEAIIVFRDWDTRACKPNAGKSCWDPGADSYLQDMKEKLPTITRFFRERHSGPPSCLTHLQTWNLKPAKALKAGNDLRLFPDCTGRRFVLFDKRDGGPAVD